MATGFFGSFHLKLIFVSISFSSRSLAVDLDRLEVVQEHAVFESPSMFLLVVSAVWILDPPFRNGSYSLFLHFRSYCHSSGPWRSSSFDDVWRVCKDVNSTFDFSVFL